MLSDRGDDHVRVTVLGADDLVGLTRSIWEPVLGRAVVPVDAAVAAASIAGAPSVTSLVAITGGWDGSVGIVLSLPGAVRAAADMLAVPASRLADDLVDDAVGELANIAAGNLKGMLVAHCRLGLPTVVRGSDYRVCVPGTRVVCEAGFDCDGEPLRVLVQSPTDLPVVGGAG